MSKTVAVIGASGDRRKFGNKPPSAPLVEQGFSPVWAARNCDSVIRRKP